MMERSNGLRSVVMQFGAAGLLIMLAIACARTGSWLLYVLLPVAILAFVGYMPVCRHRENLWTYFLVFLCGMPVNLSLVHLWFGNARVIIRISLSVVTYLTVLSVEELVMGFIAYRIWRKQYVLLFDDEDEA